jgi:SHS2 domain-containing protein
MKKYELLEHTADIFIQANGKTLAEVFENAAIGMFDILFPTTKVGSIGEFQVKLESSDLEQLLVEFLSELLYIYETQKVLFSSFKIDLDDKNFKLTAQAFGEKLDPAKHEIVDEIKAVTYHMLEFGQEADHYFVKVLFDI